MDPRKYKTFPVLVVFLLLSTSDLASGQSNQPDPRNGQYAYNGRLSPALSVVVVVAIGLLFFIGFFTVYIRHCTGAANGNVNPTGGARRRVTNATVARGLDAETIETFPTFVYSEVKTQKIGKGALECAICLNEFEDDETLRLLPKCDHVFHPHCIGAWLEGHVTCPVCRTNLAEQAKPDEPEVVTVTDLEAHQQSVSSEPVLELPRVKFSRSHTTGHSVVLPEENIDRFTLRLPEDLRKKIMANWKMNRSNSLFVLPRGGSSRSGKPVDGSRARSDRWLFRKTPWQNRDDGSIRLGGTGSIRGNSVISLTGNSGQADRWAFLRNPSFMWRNTPIPSSRVGLNNKDGEGNTPVPSPRVGVNNKDGEGPSSAQQTGTAGSASGSLRLPV